MLADNAGRIRRLDDLLADNTYIGAVGFDADQRHAIVMLIVEFELLAHPFDNNLPIHDRLAGTGFRCHAQLL